MSSVITNRSIPTAKIVLYSMLPVGVSPPAVEPMKDASARCGSRGSRLLLAHLPGGQQHDHRLADGPRDAEHDRRDDARQRRREDHARGDLELRGAEPVGALAQRLRHGRHRVLGHGRDRRDDHEAHDDPGRERVEDADLDVEQVLQDVRREEGQREVAEHDRGHAGEQLQDRLDRLARRAASRTRTGRSRQPRPSGVATRSAMPVIRNVPTTSGRTPKLAGSNSGVHLLPRGSPRCRPCRRSRSSRAAARSRSRSW